MSFDTALTTLQTNNPSMTLDQIIAMITKKADRLSRETNREERALNKKFNDLSNHIEFMNYLIDKRTEQTQKEI